MANSPRSRAAAKARAAARAEKERARRARQRRAKWISGVTLAAVVGIGLIALGLFNSQRNPAEAAADTSAGAPVSSQEQAMLEFYQCLRDNGLDVEDPENPNAMILPVDQDDAAAMAIVDQCRSLLGDGGPMTGDAGDLADTASLVDFVTCMRENGVEDMPDPSSDGALVLPEDTDPDSPEWQSAMDECQPLLGGGGIQVQRGDDPGPGRVDQGQ